MLPPVDEQQAIVRYLDHADRKIRKYVRAKQTLIKLLEEQKQAIVHQAVTRGLDPNVKLKPSGIEWLGDVPSHWEVLALKRVLRRLIDCEHKTAPKVDQSAFLVARTSSVRNGMFRREGAYPTTAEAFAQWTRRGVPEVGDIIFTREAPAGEACMVPDDVQVCLGQRTVLLKVNKARCVPDWLLHMIYAGPPRLRIQLASQGSTVGHFNVDDIGWMKILLPPAAEQSRICAYLGTATAPIRVEIGRLRDSIERLQELRTRLFADVVTGKIDVRKAAAALPDEPAEVLEEGELEAQDPEDADMGESEAEEVAE
jgi:type I restriction enzyme S subunit